MPTPDDFEQDIPPEAWYPDRDIDFADDELPLPGYPGGKLNLHFGGEPVETDAPPRNAHLLDRRQDSAEPEPENHPTYRPTKKQPAA
jgi:hypothetical protein